MRLISTQGRPYTTARLSYSNGGGATLWRHVTGGTVTANLLLVTVGGPIGAVGGGVRVIVIVFATITAAVAGVTCVVIFLLLKRTC